MIHQNDTGISSFESKLTISWVNLPQSLIQEIIKVSQDIGIHSIAIVGGFVRDQLLKEIQEDTLLSLRDLDLVIEGSASNLAYELQSQLGSSRVSNLQIHDSYNTAEMKIDGFPVDLATARIEHYSEPGQNPNITPCSLKEDLFRRDFTINAMAIDLSDMSLLDPLGGQDSLLKKELKFLHPKSVKEDPTRIIRAARYSSRLLFDLEPNSLNQIRSTLKEWPWVSSENKSSQNAPAALSTRLRLEMEILLNQENWAIALEKLQKWGGLLLFDQNLQDDQTWQRRLRWASKLKVNLLTAFISASKSSTSLAARLQLPMQQQNLLIQNLEIQEFLFDLNLNKEYLHWSPSKWTYEIEQSNWNHEAVALAICNASTLWGPLLRWWSRWRLIQSPISANELMKRGWDPGPNLGEELKRLRAKALDRYK